MNAARQNPKQIPVVRGNCNEFVIGKNLRVEEYKEPMFACLYSCDESIQSPRGVSEGLVISPMEPPSFPNSCPSLDLAPA